MRWVKGTALTLVAVVVLLLGIGLILPSTFKVQRSVDIAARPDQISASTTRCIFRTLTCVSPVK